MTDYRDLLRRHAAACEPTETERERVLRRVVASVGRPAALDRAPGPPPGAEARVLARLGTRTVRRPRIAAASLLAAAALLFVSESVPVAPYDQELSGVAHLQLSPEVELQVDGAGRVGGTRFQPALTWQIGRIDVEVEPDRNVALSVETREARVEVVGTGFTVVRDALGTVVTVAHGRVRVTCAGAASTLLGAGERTECKPGSAAGLLARAQAERASDVATSVIIADVRSGLATAGPVAVHQELRALLVQLLIDAGDPAGAAAAAAAYIEVGGPRADELRALVADPGVAERR